MITLIYAKRSQVKMKTLKMFDRETIRRVLLEEFSQVVKFANFLRELDEYNENLDRYQQALERLEKALENLKKSCDEVLKVLKSN